MNPTLEKFGYPARTVAEYDNWVVLLRPAQATLGALVLAHKSDAQAFSALDVDSFSELGRVVADLESALSSFRPYSKINYLMLMMVDREVHFHVLPRYDVRQTFDGHGFDDAGWPGPPELAAAPVLDDAKLQAIQAAIRAAWPV